jgi:hypothetical protein
MRIFYVLAFSLLLSCANQKNTNQVPQPAQISYPQSPNLDTLSPVQLLEELKVTNGSQRYFVFIHYMANEPTPNERNIHSVPQDWINQQEVDTLMTFINEKTPTVPVFNGYASLKFYHEPYATVGIEALRMISSFKDQSSYPANAPHYLFKKVEQKGYKQLKKEIVEWYESQ